MAIYTATFTAVAVTAAQDVFEITADTTTRVKIREVMLGQYSDAGDAQAELLSILFIRGYTVTGSGGSTVTPSNISGHTGALAAVSVVKANNTTVANTGTVKTLRAEAWNVQTPYIYAPEEDEYLILEAGQRLVIRLTVPADSLTVNGTLTFEEIGQGGF